LSDAPFDSVDLLVYVPKVCAPDIISEAVSGIEGVHGDALDSILSVGDDPNSRALLAIVDPGWSDTPGGILAYGECPQIAGHTSDKSIMARVNVADAALCVFFECAAMRLTCTPDGGGWKAGATVYAAPGTATCLSTHLTLDTEYTITATYNAATGALTLYVDGVVSNSTTFAGAYDTVSALPIWRVGAPPESWVTDCALWGSMIDVPSVPTVEFTDDFNRADSSSLGANWNEFGTGNLSISNNKLVTTSVNGQSALWTSPLSSQDQFIEWSCLGSSIDQRGALRCPNSSTLGLLGGYDFASGGFYIGNHLGVIATAAHAAITNQTMRFEAEGTALRLYLDGVLVLSASDSVESGLYCGFRVAGTPGNELDNFSAGRM
jgi:hypothetical protein